MASETVEQVCADVAERTVVARLLGKDSMIHNSSVASLLHDINKRIIAAHKSELAAKDAEIAKLKSCLAGDCERMRLGAEPCADCHIERINERNGIIKELADKFDRHIGCAYIRCPNEVCAKCNINYKCEIIRKARKVVSKMETTTEVSNG